MAATLDNAGKVLLTAVQQLVQGKGRLVEVPYTATVGDTLNALIAHNVVAVPVAAPPGQWIGAGGSMIVESDRVTGAARKHYIGMVGVFDILVHVTEEEEEEQEVESRLSVPVSSVIGHGLSLDSLSMWTIGPSTTVMEAMEALGKGIHRALVPLAGGGVETSQMSPGYHMLSQTDVVRFLWEHNQVLGDLLTSPTLSQFAASDRTVFAIPANMTVTNAARCMRNAQMAAVAIVDAQPGTNDDPMLVVGNGKRVVGTFSATHLRGCTPEALRRWSSMSVLDFLNKSSFAMRFGITAAAAAAPGAGPGTAMPLATCLPTCSLAQAMSTALEMKVHRVWVTDEEGLLLGVVTFSDILRTVHERAKEYVFSS